MEVSRPVLVLEHLRPNRTWGQRQYAQHYAVDQACQYLSHREQPCKSAYRPITLIGTANFTFSWLRRSNGCRERHMETDAKG
mgnify:FL=1